MTFIPNPPIYIVVSWRDTDIPILVNESSWLPGPNDNRGPSQSMEEGRVIGSYTVRLRRTPICMGNGAQCLKITSQIWLSRVNLLPEITITNFICFKNLVLKDK